VRWIDIILVGRYIGFRFSSAGCFWRAWDKQNLAHLYCGIAVMPMLPLILFWHLWLIVGVLHDIYILEALLWANCPLVHLIGSQPLKPSQN
jgi:hypothetical protein